MAPNNPAMAILLAAAAVSTLVVVSGAGENSMTFIKSSCQSTLYPDLCFTSLARYAASVRSDPVRLAWLAANVTLGRLRAVSSHVSTLRRTVPAGKSLATAALSDCAEMLRDAVDLARSSVAEIRKLAGPSTAGTEIAWHVSNAQTWMSAVMTNEDTCTDGFVSVTGPMKKDICGRIRWAREYTSNALALVNNLVANR